MTASKEELLQYVENNDVKFVKLTFCDVFGRVKNVSLPAYRLEEAFECGVRVDGRAVTGVTGKDYTVYPLPALLAEYPWRPKTGRVIGVFCEIREDGKPFSADGTRLIGEAVSALEARSLECEIGTECEFYVLKSDDLTPFDYAGYCDIAPADGCENLRRDVILNMENMGLKALHSYHERGAGQNEIDFAASEPLTSARNFIMFKSAVKNVSAISGAVATFLPKPPGAKFNNGLHIDFTVRKNGVADSKLTKSFLAGILSRYKELTCFANPLPNSYERLTGGREVYYSETDKHAVVRLCGDKITLRSPDCACNPFTLFSLVISAGLEGVDAGKKPPKAEEKIDKLFATFDEMLDFAANSEWLKNKLGANALADAVMHKREEVTEANELSDADMISYYCGI